MSDINIFLGGKSQGNETELMKALKKKKDDEDKEEQPRAVQTSLLMNKLQQLITEMEGKTDLGPCIS